jgi:hypothetical protein
VNNGVIVASAHGGHRIVGIFGDVKEARVGCGAIDRPTRFSGWRRVSAARGLGK